VGDRRKATVAPELPTRRRACHLAVDHHLAGAAGTCGSISGRASHSWPLSISSQ
jgi:hypothetical protein